ncbi:MAG TPA: RDD family protein [Acidimicrobiales bacterium]|nr:RDD family protein [Acidimicrobiales bacterium]
MANQVITPEAVVLDLPVAGLGTRMVCRAIDVLASATAAGIIVLVVLEAAGATAGIVTGILAGFGVLVLYPVLSETLWGGRSVGKLVFGLRVVRTDGGPASLGECVVRAALGLIEVFGLSAVAAVSIFISGKSQRLGDMAAGTLVVRERRSRQGSLQPVRLQTPPGLEQYVRQLDISAMTPQDYELVRQFLVRWREWRDEPTRQQIGARLAGPLWQRMRHPVPPGLPPDYYLACIGYAYQLRYHVALAQPAPGWGVPGAPGPSAAGIAGPPGAPPVWGAPGAGPWG